MSYNLELLARQAWYSNLNIHEAVQVFYDAFLEMGGPLLTTNQQVDLIRDLVGANTPERQLLARVRVSLLNTG